MTYKEYYTRFTSDNPTLDCPSTGRSVDKRKKCK